MHHRHMTKGRGLPTGGLHPGGLHPEEGWADPPELAKPTVCILLECFLHFNAGLSQR